MVEALEKIQSLMVEKKQNPHHSGEMEDKDIQEQTKTEPGEKTAEAQAEPSLETPKIGNPISHGQVVDLSKQMKPQGLEPCRLETLLKGARIYIPPPPPKPEPVSRPYLISKDAKHANQDDRLQNIRT